MNRKQLILLLLALVIVGGAGLVLVKRHTETWTQSEAQIGQKLLKNFQISDVAAIHIKGDTELTIENKTNGWVVDQRGGYPANTDDIRDLALKMADLKVIQSDPIAPSQLARMHLADPGKGADSAILLEFKDAQGKIMQSLLVGKKHTQETERRLPMSFGDEGFADGRYVMLPSNPNSVITISDPLNKVDPKPAEWLNKDFFKVEKPETVTFVSTNATNSWKVTRASESASWTLADLKPGESFDSNKVASLSSSLGAPSFVDVAADAAPEKTGLDKPLVVTIQTFDHFTYTLKIGNKTPENDYNLNVSVTAEIPKERAAGKDEKPEEKTKLDKEFADKNKAAEDRLKKEQSFSKWTYLVNTWLIDPFIRDRAQLMVEKTEKKEGAAEEKPAEPAIPGMPQQ